MVKKNPWLMLGILVFVFGSIFVFLLGSSMVSMFGGHSKELRITRSNSILHLKIEGVIMDGRRFLKQLEDYRDDKSIKAIVIEINSPGGVVGPSQELFMEIKRVRDEFQKPVVAVAPSLIASGAYYAAMGATELMVLPGTMIGSIGVIMEFTNLEKLYEWGKISRSSITTGKYKDSGAEYRPMRDDERELFQTMADDVLRQFKEAVAEGRKLDMSKVDEIADGRVFTGDQAIALGMADSIGTREDAFKRAATLAGVEKDYDVFEPSPERPSFRQWLFEGDEEEAGVQSLVKNLNRVLRLDLAGKPLFLMPGSY
jgi:protease-4